MISTTSHCLLLYLQKALFMVLSLLLFEVVVFEVVAFEVVALEVVALHLSQLLQSTKVILNESPSTSTFLIGLLH